MMPRLLAFCLATLALLGMLPGMASAQWVPPGSYLDTCRNVQVNGPFLLASCQDVRGRWVNSNLPLEQCSRGGIVNNNGRLACGRGGNGGSRRPPPGSYMESCRNAGMSGGMLQATCRAVNGRWMDSSIDPRRCRGDIANFNGRLACR